MGKIGICVDVTWELGGRKLRAGRDGKSKSKLLYFQPYSTRYLAYPTISTDVPLFLLFPVDRFRTWEGALEVYTGTSDVGAGVDEAVGRSRYGDGGSRNGETEDCCSP